MPSSTPMAAPQINFSLPYTFSTVYSPFSIRKAYGFDKVALDGTGQTIAIVDAFDAPNILTDLQAFDRASGIKDPPQFIEFKQHDIQAFEPASDNDPGHGSPPPYNENWENEISLDVEWAHAIAPGAKILLVETLDSSMTNLYKGVDFARNFAGVSVVSMSWGSMDKDGHNAEYPNETNDNFHFTTPGGHAPITFVAATGDQGGRVQYPAVAPNVLAVGGTTLNVDDNSRYDSETAWSDGGGGVSAQVKEPSYQKPMQTYGFRTVPDVAYDADPGTGFAVYCKSHDGFFSSPWFDAAGTSAGSPQWAGLIALTNQGRARAGKAPLANAVKDIYSLPSSDFHDVTDGNNGHWAHASYDLATGLGTPRANRIVSGLINVVEPRLPKGLPTTIGVTIGMTQAKQALAASNPPTDHSPLSGTTRVAAAVVVGFEQVLPSAVNAKVDAVAGSTLGLVTLSQKSRTKAEIHAWNVALAELGDAADFVDPLEGCSIESWLKN